jgi:GNAT superfamily N-acetyltransferase
MNDPLPFTIQYFDSRHRHLETGKQWLYARLDNKPVGCASIDDYGPDCAFLNDLFVEPAYRRRGVGADLIRRAEKTAFKEVRIACLTAVIDRTNDDSLSLFRKAGFQHVYSYADGKLVMYAKTRMAHEFKQSVQP